MKKHIAKTIVTLSLFVTMSVGATNVSAFPCGWCRPSTQYAVSAATQTTSSSAEQATQAASPTPTQDMTTVDAQPTGDISIAALFLMQWVRFFAQLL